MSYVRELYVHPFANRNNVIIIAGNKQSDRALRILCSIERLICTFQRTLCLPVSPFGLKLLYMRTVTEHYIAQVGRCRRCEYLSSESVFVN